MTRARQVPLRDLRDEYLFAFAHVCHMPPHVVDDLRVTDFARLTGEIDAWLEAQKPDG